MPCVVNPKCSFPSACCPSVRYPIVAFNLLVAICKNQRGSSSWKEGEVDIYEEKMCPEEAKMETQGRYGEQLRSWSPSIEGRSPWKMAVSEKGRPHTHCCPRTNTNPFWSKVAGFRARLSKCYELTLFNVRMCVCCEALAPSASDYVLEDNVFKEETAVIQVIKMSRNSM